MNARGLYTKPLAASRSSLAGVLHFEVSSRAIHGYLDTRHLVKLRCASLWYACPFMLQHAWVPLL